MKIKVELGIYKIDCEISIDEFDNDVMNEDHLVSTMMAEDHLTRTVQKLSKELLELKEKDLSL